LLEAEKAELVDRGERLDRANRVIPDAGRTRGNGMPEYDTAMRSIEDRGHVGVTDAQRDSAVRAVERDLSGRATEVVAATGDPAYFRAFAKLSEAAFTLGNPAFADLDADEKRALQRAQKSMQGERAMTAGTGSSGGYAVPLYLDPTITITGAGAISPVRQVATVKEISTLVYNGFTAAQISAGVINEAGVFSDNSPTLTQIQATTYKVGAYVPASFEAFEDIVALHTDVSQLFSDAKRNYEATAYTTDDGSSKPEGVVHAVNAVTASRVSPATGGAFVIGDVFTLANALPPRHLENASFMANYAILNKARQFGVGTTSWASFWTDLKGDVPSTLIGHDIYPDSAMDSTVTTGNKVLIFGDFKRYLIVDRLGMEVEFIPNVFDSATGRPTGQRAWLTHWRTTGKCLDPDAFRLLVL
jgi:HK97 family phage major capsid protein